MRLLICGGRDFNDKEFLFKVLDCLNDELGISYIIQGEENGADSLAKFWAKEMNVQCSDNFHAEWEKFGSAAGPKRNAKMLLDGKPDWVVAFPCANGEPGAGTLVLVSQAENLGIQAWWPHLDERFK